MALTVLIIVLAVVLFVAGALALVRSLRRRATGQTSLALMVNAVFGIVVGIVLLAIYFGVAR